MEHLFITDPFQTLIPGHDSTLALMREALHCQHQVWQCEIHNIYWEKNKVCAQAKKVENNNNKLIATDEKTINLSVDIFPLVWMRKDPPVDANYIQTCQLLRLTKAKVINNPNILMACDEKLFALEFPQLIPFTYISQNKKYIRNLVSEYGQLIAKPIGNKGGEGIFLLSKEDKNLGSLLDIMTLHQKHPIIIQEYLPEIKQGDKRVFLIAGEPVGAILRIPQPDDHRANMAAGGTMDKTEVTENDLHICNTIKPRLLELGMYVVGIDIIGSKLTEINITSPTCLEEIAKYDQSNPAGEIIQWSENFMK